MNKDRVAPSDWQKVAPDYASWPVAAVSSPLMRPGQSEQALIFKSDDERFHACLDAAIAEAAGQSDRPAWSSQYDFGSHPTPTAPRAGGWRESLKEVHRDRLGPGLRPFFDDLLIDSLEEVGAFEELMNRLVQVPSTECGPRVWLALETCGMTRLARLSHGWITIASFVRALDLWDEVMRLNWPASSHFPSQFTERVGVLASSDNNRSRLWLDRLKHAGESMAASPGQHPHAAVVTAERLRIETGTGVPGVKP